MPVAAVQQVLTDAIARELEQGKNMRKGEVLPGGYIDLSLKTGQLLGWFIHHKPSYAPGLFGEIVRTKHSDIPPVVIKESLMTALSFGGGFEDRHEQLERFFAVAFPPEKDNGPL